MHIYMVEARCASKTLQVTSSNMPREPGRLGSHTHIALQAYYQMGRRPALGKSIHGPAMRHPQRGNQP